MHFNTDPESFIISGIFIIWFAFFAYCVIGAGGEKKKRKKNNEKR